MVLVSASLFMCATISTSPVSASVTTAVTSPSAPNCGAKVRSSSISDDLRDIATTISAIMPGLDPGIHDESRRRISYVNSFIAARHLDCRVKPGNDDADDDGEKRYRCAPRSIVMKR